MASVIVWALDEYWQFTLLSLVSILGFEVSAAFSRHQALAQLRDSVAAPGKVHALRSAAWASLDAARLLPGDVVRLAVGEKAPCDALLLEGSATVGEATFSGESAPVAKNGLPPEQRELSDADSRSCIFAGTDVLAAQGELIAVVLRTGFQTKQGELMRRAVQQQDTLRDRDTLKAVLLLCVFAAAAAAHVAMHASIRERLWVKVGVILGFVVQPSLPLLMTYAVQRTLQVLKTKDIVCTEPLRVLEAGSISCCLFDKTGTLTSDHLQAIGVLEPGSLDMMPMAAARAFPTRAILGHCHDVAWDERSGRLLGDPLEVATLHGLGTPGEGRVSRRFAFSPTLRRMSVECEMPGRLRPLILTKGSPEELLPLLLDPPKDYSARAAALAGEGLRVLTLAWREAAGHCSREAAESGLQFAGFACFGSPVREEASEVVSLLGRCGVRCAIVTGDAAPTACHVARRVGLLGPGPQLVLAGGCWCPEEGPGAAGPPERDAMQPLAEAAALRHGGASLVATEVALEEAGSAAWVEAAQHATVLARMSPAGKARIVELLRKGRAGVKDGRGAGRVMMVGDGGNDVGALAAADAGLALRPAGSPGDAAEARGGLAGDVDFFDDDAAARRWREVQKQQALEEQARLRKITEEQAAWLRVELAAAQRKSFAELTALIKEFRRRVAEAKEAQQPHGQRDALGGASAAAPFTARSLRAAVELLRQGQCTKCAMVMQTQHLVLGTIIGMWRYAALSMEGARLSEPQLVLSNLALTVAFFGFIGARAVRQPSRVPAPESLFEPGVLISTLGQAGIHLWVLQHAVSVAKQAMGPVALRELLDFQRHAMAQPLDVAAALRGGGGLFSRPFLPNLLNSVIFYVEIVQGLAVLLVNYKGRPWMRGASENIPLLSASAAVLLAVTLCAAGQPEQLPRLLQLTPLPPGLLRAVAGLLALTLAGTYAVDRSVEALFNPVRARARREAPLVLADFRPALRTARAVLLQVAPALGWLVWLWMVLSFNPLLWLAAWQWWHFLRRQQNSQATR